MNHLGTKTLETSRLILRKLTLDDTEKLFLNASSDKVTRYLSWKAHQSKDDTKNFILGLISNYESHKKDNNYYNWGIIFKENNDVIGVISANSLIENIDSAYIGYWLGDKYWGRGIMTEALKEVIRFLFEEVNVKVVRSSHAPENPASGNVMLKNNMVYEGTLRKEVRTNICGITDRVVYSILREEWNG